MPEQTQNHEAPRLQRPDLGIETVTPSGDLTVTNGEFPWLTDESLEIPTVSVKLQGVEQAFRYGSLIGGNSSVAKLAAEVPDEQSHSAEAGLFKALPALLGNMPAPNIESAVSYVDSVWPVLKVAKRGRDAARLYFSIITKEGQDPVVLRLGIAQHKKQQALQGTLSQTKGNKRRKHDGGHSY